MVHATSRPGPILLLSVALGAAACSGGGGGDAGGGAPVGGGGPGASSFGIVNCSLGCAAAGSGTQFICGVNAVYVNQEIRVTFSSAVDRRSVDNISFQLVEERTGKTPPGTFVQGNDPAVLIYRPLLTFDSSGNPIFGLTPNETYFLKIPGSDLDPLGPYVTDLTGRPNHTRLQCTLVASRGILDPKPGSPRATVLVDQLERDMNGELTGEILEGVVATGTDLVDVYRGSDITIVFDDVMNPATLANPVTNQSQTIRVLVDPDGNPANPIDQIALEGDFSLTIDQTSLQTTVVFKPSGGLPSAGAGVPPRVIVVRLASSIVDLGNNTLIGETTTVFTPEVIAFVSQAHVEDFETSTFEDTLRSGSPWGKELPVSGGGSVRVLGTGPGGGSGRLGDLVVPAGVTVTLNTESEDFSALEFANPAVLDLRNLVDPPGPTEPPFAVVGGVFDFSRLLIEAGGTLRVEGANPARLYVRGETVIQGSIDGRGQDALMQGPKILDGGEGGSPGPGAGAGGQGGLRPDGSAFNDPAIGGVANPLPDPPGIGPGPANPLDPMDYAAHLNGQDGGGIAIPNAAMPLGEGAIGRGGLAWPQPVPQLPAPYPTLHFPVDPFDLTSYPYDEFASCTISSPSSPGAGGGHALSGMDALTRYYKTLQKFPPPTPPDAQGGDSGELNITEDVRTLDPQSGYLRGGAGGGGGGASLFLTETDGNRLGPPGACTQPAQPGGTVQIRKYRAHSAAGGGGGGGAIQLQAGRRAVLNGRILAQGGDGGAGNDPQLEGGSQAGGGGAGGAVLLQGPRVQIQSVPGRVDVRGGLGGIGTPADIRGTLHSTGGRGGPGFVRLETFANPLLDFELEKGKILPSDDDLSDLFGASSADILSIGEWQPGRNTMGSTTLSGAQSCWIQPQGNFFRLIFEPDGAEPGWDMILRFDGNSESYRGPNSMYPVSLESVFGNDLGAAPVVVRFQGARAVGTLSQPCSVPLSGVKSPVLTGSLTPWVKHPEELSDFHGQPSLTPNIFRFVVIWDRSNPMFTTPGGELRFEGIEEIRVRMTPD